MACKEEWRRSEAWSVEIDRWHEVSRRAGAVGGMFLLRSPRLAVSCD